MQIDHIVVPTDFSECSVKALHYGAEYARRFGAKLTLLHVYEKPYVTTAYNGGLSAAVDETLHQRLRDEIVGELKKLAAHSALQGLDVTARLVSDKPAWRIFEDFKANDLVVMGTQGITGILHGGLIGTTTERVIRNATVPVISVPESNTTAAPKRILFATDFEQDVTAPFAKLVTLAKAFDADVEVAVVNTRQTYASQAQAEGGFAQLQRSSGYAKMQLVVYNEETVEDGIRNLAAEHGIDLIALVTHGRRGLSYLVNGSLTGDLSVTLSTPILALKNN